MKYYIDTEFLEGTQEPKWLILKSRLGHLMIGKPKPTIGLISIGIVAEDGREFYEISKDFNLKEAWNRNDLDPNHKRNYKQKNNYWIRENVLKPIFNELFYKSLVDKASFVRDNYFTAYSGFTYGHLKALINYYGKTNKEIAKEVEDFCSMGTAYSTMDKAIADVMYFSELNSEVKKTIEDKKLIHVFSEIPEFYAYFADYDWVGFCWLFGKMIDLPKGFPMYCKDLKQVLDEKAIEYDDDQYSNLSLDGKINYLKTNSKYPKQSNEHNALEDARWNKELHEFLNSIK